MSAPGDLQAEVSALRVEVQALRADLAAQQRRVQELEDIEAIERLQHIYGYYVDKMLWSKVVALFSEDCEVEIAGRGVYCGLEQANVVFRKLVGGLVDRGGSAAEGPAPGVLHNHIQLQGVVHVTPDGRTAKGRWRALIQVGVLGKMAHWAEGPYEMEYVKREGKWLIRVLRWFPTFYTPYEEGWGKKGLPMSPMSADFPPDRPPTYRFESYPGVFVPPFHFRHPVTGEE